MSSAMWIFLLFWCGEKVSLLHCWWECKFMQPLLENSMEVPPKAKNRTTIWFWNPILAYVPRNSSLKSYMYSNIYNGQNMKCPSTDEWRRCSICVCVGWPGLRRSSGEGKGLSTPVFWPGEFHGVHSPLSHKELNRTEWLSLSYPGSSLDEPRDYHTKWSMSGKDKYYMISYIWNL